MIKKLLVALCLIIASIDSWSQECGVQATVTDIEILLKSLASSSERARTDYSTVYNVPMKAHVVRESDGSGANISALQIDQLINDLNSYYQQAGIQLFLVEGINYIDNSDWYDFDSNLEGQMAGPNDVKDVINVYFTNSISRNGRRVGGYAYFPWTDINRILMPQTDPNLTGVFVHEMGHAFGLLHTHETARGRELVDGSNCSTAGDLLCDTPADPLLSGNVDAGCVYTGGLKDDNGDFYFPDTRNIMSYTRRSCMERQSDQQYELIRSSFELFHRDLLYTTTGFSVVFETDNQEVCLGEEIRFQAIASSAISYEWIFEGGTPETSNLKSPKVRYNASGSYDVYVIATDPNGQTAEFEIQNYITVEDPLENVATEALSDQFDSDQLDANYQIKNIDQLETFKIAEGIDSRGLENSNSLLIDHYNYETFNKNNIDELVYATYEVAGVRGVEISFDYAYTFRKGFNDLIPARRDSLEVWVNSVCGVLGKQILKTGGDNLATAPSSNEPFIPSNDQWKSMELTYTRKPRDEYIQVIFRSRSYNGNNLYIDNLKITPDYGVDAPSDLELVNLSTESATISWRDNSVNETEFLIQRAQNGEAFETVGTVESDLREFTDSSINKENYEYRVLAKGVGEKTSEPSNRITVNNAITSIDVSEKIIFNAYPNPFMDVLNVQTDLNGKLNVYSSEGKLVYSTDVNREVDNVISTPGMKKGMYLLQFISDDNGMAQQLRMVK